MNRLTRIAAATLIAAGTLAAAVPAMAQSYPQNRYEDRYDNRDDRRWDDRDDRRHDDRRDYGRANAIQNQIAELQRRVERNDGRDRISEREAAALRRSVWNLRMQFRDYSRNGLSQREAQILQNRIQQVRQRLSYERRDNDGRRW